MRKFVAAILLILFLFGTTEAYQLLKMPLLVQHYNKHRSAKAKISFIAFLKIHYQHNKSIVVDDDYAQDMQLPFKTFDCNCSCLSSITLPPHRVEVQVQRAVVSNTNFSVYRELLCPSQPLHDIFQPPRI